MWFINFNIFKYIQLNLIKKEEKIDLNEKERIEESNKTNKTNKTNKNKKENKFIDEIKKESESDKTNKIIDKFIDEIIEEAEKTIAYKSSLLIKVWKT